MGLVIVVTLQKQAGQQAQEYGRLADEHNKAVSCHVNRFQDPKYCNTHLPTVTLLTDWLHIQQESRLREMSFCFGWYGEREMVKLENGVGEIGLDEKSGFSFFLWRMGI